MSTQREAILVEGDSKRRSGTGSPRSSSSQHALRHQGWDTDSAPAGRQPQQAGHQAPSDRAAATQSLLDKVLLKQPWALEPLLPTPTNLQSIHLAQEELLRFVEVQQFISTHLGIEVPLLAGVFVLVPTAQLQLERSQQAAAAILWRLRQVSAVEAAPGADPADAMLVLVGGDRVRTGAVHEGQLADVQDYEYLCCELAALQGAGQSWQLQVSNVAHVAWRLETAMDAGDAMEAHQQEQADMAAAGYELELLQEAGRPALQAIGALMRKVPPPNWVQGRILQYLEFNPCALQPASPDQPPQLLSAGQHTQLLQGAAAAWQHYMRRKLAGQQPLPVTAFVPWQGLPCEQSAAAETAAAAVPADAAAAGAGHLTGVRQPSQATAQATSAAAMHTQQAIPDSKQPVLQRGMAASAATSHDTAGSAQAGALGAAGGGDAPLDAEVSTDGSVEATAMAVDAAAAAAGGSGLQHDCAAASSEGVHNRSNRNPAVVQRGHPPSATSPVLAAAAGVTESAAAEASSAQQQGEQRPKGKQGAAAAGTAAADSMRPARPRQPILLQQQSQQQSQQQQQQAAPRRQVQQQLDHKYESDYGRAATRGQGDAGASAAWADGSGSASDDQQQEQLQAVQQQSLPEFAQQQQPHHQQQLELLAVQQQWQREFAQQRRPPIPKDVQAEAWSWLLELADQLACSRPSASSLDPPPALSFAVVKRNNPFPASLMQQFGWRPREVLGALPGVRWNGNTNLITIDRAVYRQLRQAAAAAAAAAGAGGQGPATTHAPSRGVKAALQAWLQQLAALVQAEGATQGLVSLQQVQEQLPVPEVLQQHYGSMEALVEDVPGLGIYGTSLWLSSKLQQSLSVTQPGAAGAGAAASSGGGGGGGAAAAAGSSAGVSRMQGPMLPRAGHDTLQAWLQQLIGLVQLGNPPQGLIKLRRLQEQQPCPALLLQHYGSVEGLAEAVPGLSMYGGSLRLSVELQQRLIGKAGAAAGSASRKRRHSSGAPQQQQQQQQQHEGRAGQWQQQLDAGQADGTGPQHQRRRQPQDWEEEEEEVDAEWSRARKRLAGGSTAAAMAAGPAAAAASGNAAWWAQDGQGVPGPVVAATHRWLQQLALQLPPDRPEISFKALWQQVPLPSMVMDHFGGLGAFVQWVPGLKWNGGGYLALEPGVLRQLRLEAGGAGMQQLGAGRGAPAEAYGGGSTGWGHRDGGCGGRW